MENVVTFDKQAAQGDLFIKRVDLLPEGCKPMNQDKGVYIVAHSETGHHHVIDAIPGVEVKDGGVLLIDIFGSRRADPPAR